MDIRELIESTVHEYLSVNEEKTNMNDYIIKQIKNVGVEESDKVSHFVTTKPIKINVDKYLYGHDTESICKSEKPITSKRKILEPVHIYIEDLSNPYLEIVDGNHRYLQALHNNDSYILGYVHMPDDVCSLIFK